MAIADGKLVIHHGNQYRVMTNSPTCDKQLAIIECWKDAGGFSAGLQSADDRL